MTAFEFLDAANEDLDSKVTLTDKLKKWALDYNCTHSSVDALLCLLREEGHPHLPKSARGLLSTPTDIKTTTISGMEYYYLGFSKHLTNLTKVAPRSCYKLALNIDGLPLFKSSSTGSLWPVFV